MFSAGKSFVGLDIGSSTIKAVELSRVGKGVQVTGIGQVEARGQTPEDQIRAVADLLKQGGFKTKRVVTAVSGKMVIIRYLSMVPMSDEELRNAILFEAEKYIPFGLDESTIDCQRIGKSGGNDNVILVAVKTSALDSHMNVAQKAGFTPEIVDVDAIALGNAYDLVREYSEDQAADGAVMAFVDVGATKTCVNIMQDGVSLFTREIYFGGRDFTSAIARRLGMEESDAESLKRVPGDSEEELRDAVFPTIDDLGNELQLSFDYFENQHGRSPDRVLLSGGGSRLPFFQESFERILERPVSIFNPFDGLPVSDDIDQDMLIGGGPQMAIAVGLAARIRKS
ncbi:MAG: type IV pilus assembly protein PilM [Planctomycetes bacterium]|nr:type IV pilus assembly protein PilM [Planctomycetota bacterium]